MGKTNIKSGFVVIIGRPSAGKSTLMNSLCREKISIVTTVPQTTRNRIRGIISNEQGQIVFIDTPGLHHSARHFNIRMKKLTQESINHCDLILYVVDLSRKPGIEEANVIRLVSTSTHPYIIAYNKSDMCSEDRRKDIRYSIYDSLKNEGKREPCAEREISALTGDGLDELQNVLFAHLPEGEALYPDDVRTDQGTEFRIAEIIRERAMVRAREELPHAIYVEIQDLEIWKEKRLWVRAFICVEARSQIGLVVGKGGGNIKEIRRESQREIGKILPYRIYLDLRVKCSHNWRHKDGVTQYIVH